MKGALWPSGSRPTVTLLFLVASVVFARSMDWKRSCLEFAVTGIYMRAPRTIIFQCRGHIKPLYTIFGANLWQILLSLSRYRLSVPTLKFQYWPIPGPTFDGFGPISSKILFCSFQTIYFCPVSVKNFRLFWRRFLQYTAFPEAHGGLKPWSFWYPHTALIVKRMVSFLFFGWMACYAEPETV